MDRGQIPRLAEPFAPRDRLVNRAPVGRDDPSAREGADTLRFYRTKRTLVL